MFGRSRIFLQCDEKMNEDNRDVGPVHAPNSGCAPGSRLETWWNVLKQVENQRENAGNATVQVPIIVRSFHGFR